MENEILIDKTPAPVIEIKGLVKKFNGFTAVAGIDLSIKEGEIFGLLGPNGAGKTTTLLMLATLLKPTAGSALVNGFDIVAKPSKVRKSIGIVFQGPSSDDLLTGYENLKLHAMLYGVPSSIRKQRINEALELVDLTNRRNDLVKKYSGGMRRRLELARGLLHHPKIIFMDEPTLGLDPNAREQIWAYIKKLSQVENVSIIITTHYMEEADLLCDRVAIVDHGKIVALDTPDSLKRKLGGDIVKIKMQNPDVTALKGMNFVKTVTVTDNIVLLTVEDAGKHLPEILKGIGAVESVEMRIPTLNDVFLHYAGREFRAEEESAEGDFWQRAMDYEAGGNK
jgi:ABC-2 type transport system ATP-binding protein